MAEEYDLSELDRAAAEEIERQGLRVNRRNMAIAQVICGMATDLENRDIFADIDASLLVISTMSAIANTMATQSGLAGDEIVEIATKAILEQKELSPDVARRMGVALFEVMNNRQDGFRKFEVSYWDPLDRRRTLIEFGIVYMDEDRAGSDRILYRLSDEAILALVGMLDAHESSEIRFVDVAIRRAIERGHYDEAVSACISQKRAIERLLRSMTRQTHALRRGVDLRWEEAFGRTIDELLSEIQDSLDRTLELGRTLDERMRDPATQSETRRKLAGARRAVDELSRAYSKAGPTARSIHLEYGQYLLGRIGLVEQPLVVADIASQVFGPALVLQGDDIEEFVEFVRPRFLPSSLPVHVDAGAMLDLLWNGVADDVVKVAEEEADRAFAEQFANDEPIVEDDFDPVEATLQVIKLNRIVEETAIRLGPSFDMRELLAELELHPEIAAEDLPLVRKLAWTWPAVAGRVRFVRTGVDGTFVTSSLEGENVTFASEASEELEREPRKVA